MSLIVVHKNGAADNHSLFGDVPVHMLQHQQDYMVGRKAFHFRQF
jgi:hypothetical protein